MTITRKKWTPEEDAKLKDYLLLNYSSQRIGKLMGRTPKSISVRKGKFDKVQPVVNKKHHNSRWNEIQDEKLISLYKKKTPIEEIAKLLGRTINAISFRLYTLKITKTHTGKVVETTKPIDTKDPKIKKYEEIPVSKNSDVEKILSRYEKTEITEDESEIETKFIDMEPIMQSNFIGKGGQNIKNMSKHFNVKLYVLEDKVSITGSKINIQKVLEYLKVALKTPVVGEVYDAMVVNTHSFGTFFALNPFYSGLLHIKNYDPVKDIFVPGDIIRVKVDKYISPKQIQLFLVQKAPEPEDVDNYIKEHLYKGLTEQLHAPIEVFSKFIKRKIEYKVSGVRNEDEIVYTVKISLK